MQKLRIIAMVLSLGVGAQLATSRNSRAATPPVRTSPTASETYAELAPILLPESGAPPLTKRPGAVGDGGDVVFRFVVDTLGRVELSTVETLAATDSATARDMREGLSGVRYVPARLVRDVGRCVTFNGVRAHCGGSSPAVKRIRSRVVLHIVAQGTSAR